MPRIGNVYPYSSVYPGKFNVVPTGFETAVADAAWNSEFSALANEGVRVLIAASEVIASGSTVKVKFTAATVGNNFGVDGAFIGHQASSGDAYDFDGNQARLTFSASNGFDIAPGASIVSDEIAFNLDDTKNLIVAFGVTNDITKDGLRRQTSATNFTDYIKLGGNGEEGTTNVTGYSSTASQRSGVGLIEVK